MKLQKISNLALYIASGLTVLMLLLFFLLPWEQEGDKSVPVFTSPFLIFQYLMVFATAGLVIWSVVRSAQNSAGADEKKTTGIPGKKIIIFTSILTIISLVVGAVLGIGEEDFTTTSGVFTPGYMVTLVDAFIWSIYILAAASAIAVVVAATGVLTKSATK
ncbi:MAG: hypothetical protein HUK02_08740 [Bacteroidaceae bacterium]|nr:hypothetical protein [Bacteroidaceae bacterium]MCF0199394.1 hypothetical protein [Bacteroidaceae bacterium]